MMLSFYKQVAASFLALVLLSAAIILAGLQLSTYQAELLPNAKADFTWRRDIAPDELYRGTHTEVLDDSSSTIRWKYTLSKENPFPYSAFVLDFTNDVRDYVDLSAYERISFHAKCSPQIVHTLVVISHDDSVTVPDDEVSGRVASSVFPCNTDGNSVTFRLRDIKTADWWLWRYERKLTEQDYDLSKVIDIRFVNTSRQERERENEVEITDLILTGEDWRFLNGAIAAVLFFWLLFFVIIFKRYCRLLEADVKARVLQDKQFIAYKALTIAPQKDKEKSGLLQYLATEYANPDLSLETVCSELGINRTKVNEILKAEIGMTFSGYLNKLRLTESARLLSEHELANVSEIAHQVGYNNPSYFNKLFKSEYGCTPKSFKEMYAGREPADAAE